MTDAFVEVVFALPDSQAMRKVPVEEGATVADAIAISGLVQEYPQFNLGALAVGIWGRVVPADQVVTGGDRVEIYRPLAMDPKDARRHLAEAGRTMSDK